MGKVAQWFTDVGKVAAKWMPKVIVAYYYVFFAKAWYYVVDWFIAFDWTSIADLPPTVAIAIAGFPAAILAVLTTVLKTLTEIAFKAMNGSVKTTEG